MGQNSCKRLLACTIGAALLAPAALLAQTTDLADGPLAQPATSVKPNMLLILDDSGSMARQFTPDYVSSNSNAGTVANCFDGKDGDALITMTPLDCFAGDPPAMSPDFNTQYYNPDIRYFPAVNYDGSSKGSMDSAATTAWTVVPTDSVSSAAADDARKTPHGGSLTSTTANGTHWDIGSPGTAVESMDLVAGWPDRVWCQDPSDSATDAARCKTNSSYTYPEFTFGYGKDSSGNRRYKLGTPYYYRITPTEFCNNVGLISNTAQATPGCIAATSATGEYTFPARVRFCNSTAHTDCQGKRNSTYRFPKFLGTVDTGVGNPGAKARGIILLQDGDAGAPTIQQIRLTKLDASIVVLLSAPVTTVATDNATNRTTAATTIRNAINANTSAGLNHGYVASLGPTGGSDQELRIDAPVTGVVHNGTAISVDAPATGSSPAGISLTMGGANNSGDKVSALRFGPPGGPAEDLIAAGGVSCGSGCSNTQMATRLRDAINALTATHGYTATSSGSTVTITAPAATGSERNGWPMAWSDTGLTNQSGSLSGGSTVGDLTHATSNFTGGAEFAAAGSPTRLNVGTFVRTNIMSGQTYPKAPARSDCAGATSCTYDEEMTNFANWFAYYRTRFQMAKTSIGRAFLTLGSDFRVGFMTINFSTTHYLAVNDFNTAAGQQKSLWFDELYDANGSGATPLRAALSRAGRYYGNQDPGGTMGASPIQQSCQPSYSILTSDGYWNDSSGYYQLNGSTNVGNQDSGTGSPPAEVTPYATKSSGSWDGNGVSNTLADVAMYYYKTDLRTDLADQVPASGKDNAPHQHMTTFTVGMGLAGTFNYDPNYETQSSGDFKDVTQGTKLWPNPGSQEEAKLDDLWHAAVNGRGKFFSAQDPVALANGIAETLNSVQARIGAGAAAATSNLQPVAGDNFAFTAQYQTVEWSGDLKARTIDLSTGAVATRELWSAQSLLDQRDHPTRRIFTFDQGDTDNTVVITVDGASRTQNANKLRSFCATDSPAASYPNCDDGGLLTAAEMTAHFDPLGGPNGQLYQSVGWPTDGSNRHLAATKLSLVDYLRGETVNETSGGTATTDLYRNRAHLLGDIVNAQPAYVKAPPFQYSDPNYGTFKSTNAGRFGMVFAAANDGMLHAFATDPDNNPYFQTDGIATAAQSDDVFTGSLSTDAVTGEGSENWAYVPSMVFPTLKRLAETNYSTNHRYSVDGSPVVADVCFGHSTATPCASAGNWKTILVGGLNKGGRGYYALDITNPQSPVALWELKGGSDASCIATDAAVDGTQTGDCNIGLTFANPIIAKRPSDGKWVVFVTSGHNNVSPGDGLGHLYMIDVQTGVILQRMSTPAGSATAPSGLARINGWVDNASQNNTVRTIYGGDLLGNLWRFQLELVDNPSPIPDVAGNTLTLLATVTDPSGTPQPITTRPELGQDPITTHRIIFIATGKFLGVTDKADEQRQSVYAIKDEVNASGLTAVVNMARSGTAIAGFKEQTLTTSSTTRTVADNDPVDFASENGWFVDLPDGGTPGAPSERVNVDPILQLGTLVVPSNVPSSDTCVAGGFGWVNFFDYRSGGYVEGASGNMVSTKISASLVVGINVVQLPGGTVKTIVTTADNQQITQDTPVAPSSFAGKRVTWRELFVE